MLTTSLHYRALGITSPFSVSQAYTSRLLLALQPAFDVRFAGHSKFQTKHGDNDDSQIIAGPSVSVAGVLSRRDTVLRERAMELTSSDAPVDKDHAVRAHGAGVNAIVVDKFEGRYLLSGTADGQIAIWDLEAAQEDELWDSSVSILHQPSGTVAKYSTTFCYPNTTTTTTSANPRLHYRSNTSHEYGITHLSFYPFDSLAFLSSSYDHTLKLYSSTTLNPSASFDLSSVIYSHAISPIASHLLVACGVQQPAIRLVDLRSGAATHFLAGHNGAVLSLAWSPRNENILASGGTDGTVRFWDIRRSAGTLGVLDMDDSMGSAGYEMLRWGARGRQGGKAHNGSVNGVVWTDDGKHVVTTGHDERVRVWDTATGANTLANFGPLIKNQYLSTLLPLVVPKRLVFPCLDVLFYPNEQEILMFEIFEGRLMKRMSTPGVTQAIQRGNTKQPYSRSRVTALTWRAHSIELYSAHSDGEIRLWRPRTSEAALLDEEEQYQEPDEEIEDGYRKRKRPRNVLNDIHQELTSQKITFC